ncbi:MAG TPA: DDE-type integrase/transposase/recombinase [Thermoanaerobaculia bacterium]|jgi:putative transposase|nr:DDE-type integrase/transposase/recombinase [Thermoanaerobaculia bacterium]
MLDIGLRAACTSLGLSRATVYRKRCPASSSSAPTAKTRRPPLALSEGERRLALEVLHSPRFVDAAPGQVYATLLDEGVYLGSERTLYRLLAQQGESRERRDQLRHPAYTKPELLADAPNRVWSWDITKLKGPTKWCHYQLYIVLDIFSRYVVAWMLAECEAASLV